MTTTQEEVTLESLQTEIDELRRQRLEERQQIVEIARRAARDNGLCEVVDRALTRAGLLGGEQVTIQANVPVQIVTYVDIGSDIPSVQEMVNTHAQAVADALIPGLGHVKALSNGNVRNQDARISLNGAIQVVAINQGAAPRTGRNRATTAAGRNAAQMNNNWANPPQGYLALYTRPQGRSLHFVRALEEHVRDGRSVNVGGIEFNVHRAPMCSGSSYVQGWQEISSRAEGVGQISGICLGCRDRALHFGWTGPR